MRVPLGWLAEWIDLPGTPEKIAAALTSGGLEVDGIEKSGPELPGLVVGDVLERGAHPNADRLALCRVEPGTGEPVEVVCGAPNVAAGQKIAFAPVGTRLPDGTKLKKSKIRGVTSLGMICSERELGLSEEHEGILVLETDAPAGTPLDQVLPGGETVLDVAITTNRGDCASMIGMARELRAHFGGKLRLPDSEPSEARRASGDDIQVTIEDSAGCHRYDARVVRGVRVGPSPEWLVERLEAAGLRAINNIVDVSNLVMLEFGQPLHAFDLARIGGAEIRVRSASEGERITTLDGEDRALLAGDLVIADAKVPVAIAGVMGGAESEVSESTSDLLIESAHFDPARVRRTGRRLGLTSEASYRFERGVDREGVARAADRAAKLISELAGGQASQGSVSSLGDAPDVVSEIALSCDRLNRLLGTRIAANEMDALLERVGVTRVASGAEAEAKVATPRRYVIPSYRNDLRIREDLIEEVARIHGYDAIEPSVQTGALVAGRTPRAWTDSDRVRDALQAEGLTEVMSLPFLDPRDFDRLGLSDDDPRRVTPILRNPIAESDCQLRSSLVPSLLRLVRENRNRQLDRVAGFEVCRVFRTEKEGELPEEELRVAAVLTRGEDAHLWEPREPAPLFFDAKGVAERLLDALGYRAVLLADSPQPYLHPGASTSIRVGKARVGELGELHPEAAARFAIDVPCAIVDVSLSALASVPVRESRYREVSKHPAVRRDLAVVVNGTQPSAEIAKAIGREGGSHLVSVEVFDRYEGEGVPEGRASLAFRLVFQRGDRTLTDAEVAKSVDRIVAMLGQRFDGELR